MGYIIVIANQLLQFGDKVYVTLSVAAITAAGKQRQRASTAGED